MKQFTICIALLLAAAASPALAGGLFAGDDNMHVQGHPYMSTSYHKAYHGADSFITLPEHGCTSCAPAASCGCQAAPACECEKSRGCGLFSGSLWKSCGCRKPLFSDCKLKMPKCLDPCGLFQKRSGCETECGCEVAACGCLPCPCEPACRKKWSLPKLNLCWWKKDRCCPATPCETCSTCSTCGHGTAHELSFPATEGVGSEIVPVPAEATSAPPQPSGPAAQFRRILPPTEAIVPTGLMFPFLGDR
ncbi:MAG: hypothetical protein DWQ31_01950 [Planctomycetota bacterium]|nr:MAG: hypothetical protein DWQ31_01950 [Planctomycetota bacterium]